MKIALAQLNFKIADFEKIQEKIIEKIKLAKAQGAHLVVFSELAIGGSPALDFYRSADFMGKVQDVFHAIRKACEGIDCIIGMPHQDTETGSLSNAALLISDGVVKGKVTKKKLDQYGEVAESPYFIAGEGSSVFESNGTSFILAFGSDLPVLSKTAHPAFLLSLNNMPFSYMEHGGRLATLKDLTAKLQIPVIELNQVGAQGSLIFDGRSMILSAEGELLGELEAFEEDFKIIELSANGLSGVENRPEHSEHHEIALIHRALVFGIRDYFEKNGFRKALIGFSGGLDSSLVGALACEALGAENVKGVLMPSMYSTDHSVKDAQDLAANLGCESEIVPIKEAYDVFKKLLDPVFRDAPEDVTEQNIQARVRAVILMSISNKENSIVLNTSNKSEAAMGYGTLYGDLVGSLSVLGDVYKSQIFEIAKYMNRNGVIIPENTISKPPSAELAPGQKDSDAIPEYHILDPILFQLIEKGQRPKDIIDFGFDSYEVGRVVSIMGRVGFKLFQTPPALRVSPKAFGSGYQLPLVANFSR